MAGLERLFEGLGALPLSKKMSFLTIMIISIASMFILYTWIQKADYQVLYSNLSEDDAGKIVQELTAGKIPYQLAAGSVLVPSNKVYDVRLQLASQGIPQGGGVGFEIFDNTNFTTSEFVQKLNFRRALEGELARTIRSLSGVEQARVHLAVPDKSIFAFSAEKAQATAAVFVSLNQGRRLSSREVDGIVHLVSSSVEDLRPNNITVVDSKGELLSKPGDDSVMSLSSTQMDYRQSFEKNMSLKILGILEPVVGAGRIKAKVSSDFDFTRSERTEEIFDPDGVVVRSEQKSTEKSSSGGGPAGIPGTASNLPGGASAGTSASGAQSQKQDEMINYETSKTVKRTIESPVTLERITVAILIDGILPSQKDSIENPDKYVVHSEEDVKYYEDIIKKTIGYSEDRGDEISLSIMPFKEVEQVEMGEAETDIMPMVFTVLRYFAPVAVALLFFLLVLKPLIGSLSKVPPRAATAAALAGGEQARLEEELKPKEIPVEKQVIEWANKNPQQAAGVVKSWLEEK
jgi:flagellar M-ring protein FliF